MWALLPASHTLDIISKTAEAQRARHSFKALCSQMTLSSKMKLLLLGNWSSLFGDSTRQQISIAISHLNEEHFSGICQREAKASLFLVTQCTMFAQWEEQQALHNLFHTCSPGDSPQAGVHQHPCSSARKTMSQKNSVIPETTYWVTNEKCNSLGLCIILLFYLRANFQPSNPNLGI